MWRIIWTTWNRVTSTWLSYGKTGMFEHGVYRPKIAFHREHDDNPWDTISFAPNLSYEPKYYNLIQFLVGGLEHFLFSHILGIMIPTDFHIFQRGWNHQPDFMWHVRKICWETSQKGSDFFFRTATGPGSSLAHSPHFWPLGRARVGGSGTHRPFLGYSRS